MKPPDRAPGWREALVVALGFYGVTFVVVFWAWLSTADPGQGDRGDHSALESVVAGLLLGAFIALTVGLAVGVIWVTLSRAVRTRRGQRNEPWSRAAPFL